MTQHSLGEVPNLKSDSAGPFFIVGSDRSGTTMLRLMLNGHSRLHVPRETWFLIDLLEGLPAGQTLSEAECLKAHSLMIGQYRWPDLELSAEELKHRILGMDSATLRDVATLPFQMSTERRGKPRWGDKTPPYVKHIPGLADLFPNALFIHVIRDARDVCLSLRDRGWHGDLSDQARFWADHVEAGIQGGAYVGKARYLEVHYEALVLQTEETLRQVCLFLGEDFQEGMLAFHVTAGSEVAGWESKLHEKLVRPPRETDVARWKTGMAWLEVLIVEAVAGSAMDQVGQIRSWRGPRAWVAKALWLVVLADNGLQRILNRIGIQRTPLRFLIRTVQNHK